MAGAVKNLRAKYDEQRTISAKISRRWDVLQEHIRQGENYNRYSKVYWQYRDLKGDRADKFYDKHREAITAFTEAHKYMVRHLNGRKQIPMGDWRKEFAELSHKHDTLLVASEKLSAEIKARKRFTAMLKRLWERVTI